MLNAFCKMKAVLKIKKLDAKPGSSARFITNEI
jgi:hypothetical protein